MTALTSTVRTRRVARARALGPIVALAAAALAALPGAVAHAATPLADQPLFAASDAPGNLALVLSVEFPTAISVAHLDRDYHSTQEYLGFFDPAKCYRYVGQAASTASAVTDGSFENPPQNGGYTYGATGGAWTFDNGGGLTANQNPFTSGNPNTPDGQQVAFLQLGGRARQTITLTAGTTYYVSFRAAQRGNYQSGTQSVRISIDGDTLGTFTPPSTSYSTSPTYSYTATSGGSHTIQLVGTGGGGGDYTAFVDSVAVVDSSTPVAATLSDYYRPVGLATARRCSGEWSGNFLNWATMQVIDPFRWVLTGGYRVVDTPTTTVVEKAWGTQQGSTGNFPDSVLSAAEIAGATPFGATGTPLYMRIWGLGNKMRFALPDPSSPGASPWLYGGATSFSLPASVATNTVYEVFVRAQVCDTTAGSGGPEANCTPYGANYKPEGLIQKYSNKIRYSAFAYLNDDNMQRDGGVLRARQTFVGPTRPVPGSTPVTNTAREWSPTTGVFVRNPSPADATATNTLFGTSVQDSGVMNYLNKFGEITPGSYKTYDNVSELYYAAIRYFKNQGNVPEWTDMSWMGPGDKAKLVDGFPVITEWDDPILYSCQRNFILGIGDVNTWADKNLPGSTLTQDEPSKPAAVAADATVDALEATNKIGVIEGWGPNLGYTTPYNGCCNNNSALIAGLAYDSHTKDIRPNDFQTAGVARDPITIDTYWVDILEYLQYKPNNQFYLAAKYGGFKVPKGYSFQNNTTPLDPSWWTTNADNLSGQRRPDNYFTGGRPDLAAAGLTAAFADIASKIKNYTTSFSTSLPQVAVAGNASYSSQYDAAEWKGEIKASELSFDAGGIPQMVEKWNFSTLLAAQLADTGWSTSRRVATWNTETLAGVPFRAASISGAQRTALDTLYASGDDSTEYVNYLRGDQSNETNSVVAGSSKAYRHRTVLLGDIVGSKARPIGPPSFPYSDAANPGYATFKQTWSTRPSVVYVGANDGMLHAINGSLSLPGGGVEMFAYVPGALYQGPGATPAIDGLAALGNPTFLHRYFVNATPNVYDVDFGRTPNGSGAAQAGTPDWRSVLIGGLGKGGRSYYALDVTDPASMASGNETALARKVLWEFSDPDLGFGYGEPIVTKTRKYGWVVIFVSGYNNTTGQGYFFVVNPRTGALLEKVSTGVGSTSDDAGLANVNAFVYDASDGTADAAYAGDLLGNVWRLDLTGAAGAAYPAPKRFAVLTDSSGTAQPVTSRPSIEVHPSTKKRFVMLGTGRMLATSDIASSQRQTFYVIADGNNARFNRDADLPTGITFPIGRARLAANVTPVTSGITYDPNTQMGWYEELGGGTNGIGWRVTSDSSTFAGSVAFAATLPDGSICNPSGSSRIYARDYAIGATTVKSSVDAGLSPVPYVTFNGTVTDLRYLSVGGRATLISGTDLGSVTKVEINPAPSLGLRRLNWRELPLVE